MIFSAILLGFSMLAQEQDPLLKPGRIIDFHRFAGGLSVERKNEFQLPKLKPGEIVTVTVNVTDVDVDIVRQKDGSLKAIEIIDDGIRIEADPEHKAVRSYSDEGIYIRDEDIVERNRVSFNPKTGKQTWELKIRIPKDRGAVGEHVTFAVRIVDEPKSPWHKDHSQHYAISIAIIAAN